MDTRCEQVFEVPKIHQVLCSQFFFFLTRDVERFGSIHDEDQSVVVHLC